MCSSDLLYGAALIIMMRVRPEGLWPSATRRRELRDEAGESVLDEPEEAAALARRRRVSDLQKTEL